METILIILFCLVLLSGFGDLIFDVMKGGIKIFLGIVLILASVWLIIKMTIVMVPWIFVLSIVGVIVGAIWLIKALVRKI